MYDASNRKDIRRAEKAQRLDDRQAAEVMANIMSTVPGRAWIWRLLSSCHVFSTTVNRDPILMGYAEGERNVGLQLISQIMSACPDSYIQMMREGAQRDAARTRDPDEPGDGESAELGDSEPREWPADSEGYRTGD